MSYRDWSDEGYIEFHDKAFEEIFNDIRGVHFLDDDSYAQAEELFEKGWLTFGEYSKEELDDMRNDFYDLVGLYDFDDYWETFDDLYSEANG